MKDIPQSQKFGLVNLTERKMAELRNRGHRNIVVIGGENGKIRIRSVNPDEETVITEVNLNGMDSWLRDYFARRNSIGKGLRNLDRDSKMLVGQERFGDGAAFGPTRASAMLYLAIPKFSYPQPGEIRCEEKIEIESFENGGDYGLNDYSALLIIEAMFKEVDQNGRNSN